MWTQRSWFKGIGEGSCIAFASMKDRREVSKYASNIKYQMPFPLKEGYVLWKNSSNFTKFTYPVGILCTWSLNANVIYYDSNPCKKKKCKRIHIKNIAVHESQVIVVIYLQIYGASSKYVTFLFYFWNIMYLFYWANNFLFKISF